MLKYSDSPSSAEKWDRLEKKTSAGFVNAMRELYSIYDPELPEWFAGLYEPRIGGFYYSNSARDNEKIPGTDNLLLPDIESICQALGFIGRSGMTKGKPYADFLPDLMKKENGDYK